MMRAQQLLAEGADSDSLDDGKVAPLHWAAQRGNVAMVKLLIAHGADINASGSHGSPLHLAALHGHADVANALLAAGAVVNARHPTAGGAPLHFAAAAGHIAVAQLLVDNGATISQRQNDGRTPAEVARATGHSDLARQLLPMEADKPRQLSAPQSVSRPTSVNPSMPSAIDHSGDTHAIQLGAFQTGRDTALQHWQQLQLSHADLLGELTAFVYTAQHEQFGLIHRLLSGPLLKSSAIRLCLELKSRGHNCIAVQR